jgi:hypothetical protein
LVVAPWFVRGAGEQMRTTRPCRYGSLAGGLARQRTPVSQRPGLSIRRADSVKSELVRDGVPATAITTQGFGETHLLVSTGPGVREPQNRRVEIVLH